MPFALCLCLVIVCFLLAVGKSWYYQLWADEWLDYKIIKIIIIIIIIIIGHWPKRLEHEALLK